ncbi:MAG TPA: cupin domain-containing protein [Thermoanaerobaculia bacterium]|nr:cupin domain-containing protein [Thermoanaerobaculia bacterium]HQR66598.1 cupin domain-containing protein [Thermoanaerobaculia bacterium]
MTDRSADRRPVDLAEKLSRFREHWSPKIVGQVNDLHLKLVKFAGEFVWHAHAETDEVFLVLEGEMTIHFRDGDVPLRKGELFVVPKGVDHKTSARAECHVLLIERTGTVNTGEEGGEKTAPADAWI